MNTLQFNLLVTLILGFSFSMLIMSGIEQYTEMPIPVLGHMK